MRALPVSIAAGAALVLGLTACGSSTSSTGATSAPGATSTGAAAATAPTVHPPLNKDEDRPKLAGITVTGDGITKTPTVTIADKPVSVTATTVRVLTEGKGPASTGASRVSIVEALFHGTTGKQLDTSYGKPAQSFVLSSTSTIPGLNIALDGVKAGSRILFAIPPADAFGAQGNTAAGVGPTDNLVVVADIISVGTPLTKAQGAPVAPKAGLPTVTFDEKKGPTITVPKTEPSKTLVVQPLVQGTGATVTSGQSVTVHYTGVTYSTGEVFDSSWTKGSPFTFTIGGGQVIPGWDKGLIGQKVGSRVLLVIPPAAGYGAKAQGSIPANSTLVFAIDILDAG
ncbi:MAG: FKBP-type peptidyl-prolyl cis-trans isomerase [Actinomycetota bacterium]|nr:FKBP-type peptidyl-prolyl cis-trans isomerase [Actinomycetota bacterium]